MQDIYDLGVNPGSAQNPPIEYIHAKLPPANRWDHRATCAGPTWQKTSDIHCRRCEAIDRDALPATELSVHLGKNLKHRDLLTPVSWLAHPGERLPLSEEHPIRNSRGRAHRHVFHLVAASQPPLPQVPNHAF